MFNSEGLQFTQYQHNVQLSPQTIEQKKYHDIYVNGNPGPDLGHVQKCYMVF